MHAVINNTRSEPDRDQSPADNQRDKRTVEGHAAASNEWIQNLGKKDEDEFGEWPLSPEEEKKVATVVERKSVLPGTYPETPRKAVKTSHFDTPGIKRKREDEMLPTPVTGASRIGNHLNAREDTQDTVDTDIFTTPTRPSVGQNAWESSQHSGLRRPSHTPTPSRFRDATEPTEGRSDNPQQSYDISEEVMDLLKDQHIDEETTSSLRKLLNKHALKISGIAKGRDITRVALKAKDVKIAGLQQKITALETEREMDKTVIRHFKSDIAESVAKRGRGEEEGGLDVSHQVEMEIHQKVEYAERLR